MLGVWFRALTQDYLDVQMGVAPNISARIIERPGLWMNPEAASRIVEDLRAIARATVPGETLDYGVLTGSQERLEHAILTVLYDNTTKQPVAFNALSVMDVTLHGRDAEVVHLGLVMVDPALRSHGLSWVLYGLTCLVLFVRRQLRPLWLSNVTQVPAIVGMVSETFSEVFPMPGRRRALQLRASRARARDHGAAIARCSASATDAGFDENRFVITNAYTGGSDNLKKSFDVAPKHRDAVYNEFCRQQLDYARGDDVLQLCRLDLAAAQRFVTKDIPRRSLPAVAGDARDRVAEPAVASDRSLAQRGPPVGNPAPCLIHRTALSSTMSDFNYAEFTTRNIGFVTRRRAGALRQACVFVCGTGGMGGAALMALARAGVGRLIVADIDAFEISNLNRQVFAFTDTVGRPKAEAAAEARPPHQSASSRSRCSAPNGRSHRSGSRERAQVVVNGTDDLAASLLLYRTARAQRPARDRRLCVAAALGLCHARRRGDAGGAARLSDHRQGLERRHARRIARRHSSARSCMCWSIPRRATTSIWRPPPRSRPAAAAACRSPRWSSRPAC